MVDIGTSNEFGLGAGCVLRHTSTRSQDQRFAYTKDGRLRQIHDPDLGTFTTYA